MKAPSTSVYAFGPFLVDGARRLLLRDGQQVSLPPKVLETLLTLVEHRTRVVTKDELLKAIWGDTIVEEGGLARNISLLRKALGEKPDDHHYVVTVPGRGYQFVAEVCLRDESYEAFTTPPHAIPSTPTDTDPLLREVSGPNGNAPPRRLFGHRWLALGTIATLTLAIAAYAFRPEAMEQRSQPIRSIAVLPLENLSGDPGQEYFVDGITESLIGNLARVRMLRIVSRTSVMRFKGPRPPLKDVARALDVDAIVEGTVQRADGRVKISIQLIDGRTDTHLWAREYERKATDILALQGELARGVADEIRVYVSAEDRRAMALVGTVNSAAYQEYLLGQFYLWKRLDEDLVRAIQHFERAARLDPGYAAAHAGISHAWWWRGIVGPKTFRDVEPASRSAAMTALALDARLPEAYVSIGRLKYGYDWDWLGAQKDFRRALEIEPNNIDALFFAGMVCMALGCFDEGIAALERAAQLDPLSSTVQSALGRILYRARRFDEAVVRLKQAIALEPRNRGAYGRLADVHRELGQYADALALLEQERAAAPLAPWPAAATALIYARTGKRVEAQRILETLGARSGPGRRMPIKEMAGAYAALGEKDKAFELLFRNLETRDTWTAYTMTDPSFVDLHSDPRWSVLLRRLNFPNDGGEMARTDPATQ
jgi:TolB-like protein/DNA-binding winged helix-turn-helix (wHTH) protein/Tfp pilus assembly protein PilF